MIAGPFADRDDAAHVLAQLPPVGGPEKADVRFAHAVERWSPRRGAGGLVLLGPTGTGKTTAAVHLVRLFLARFEVGTSTLFALASDLAESRELAERAKLVRLLVLDDLGKEKDPSNRIFQVLDHRHTRNPTVITTGIKPEDLDAHYDGATIRRMFEFRGHEVARVSAFRSTQQSPRPVRGPGDQEELARRLGERL